MRSLSSKTSIIALGFILLLSAVLMMGSSLGESAIMDELAHIPAGYSYMEFNDFRLNPEHPPLLKAISAFPLLFANLNFPTESRAWQTDINGQWDAGRLFLYESGNDADLIIQLSRLGPILITLLLILSVYLWSRAIMGPGWALIPTLLTALSPSILAHGHYVTTDISAAFGAIFATFFFLVALVRPSWKSILLAGIAFGIAQLLKFSMVLLIPYFLVLTLVYILVRLIQDTEYHKLKEAIVYIIRRGLIPVAIFAIGFVIMIYPMYALFTANYPIERQVSDTEAILTSFADGPTPEGELCSPLRCMAEATIWMAGKKITQPAGEYFLGVLMVIQRASGGNTAYFLGEVSAGGSRAYFPLVYALKEPLPVLLVVFIALLWGLWLMASRIYNKPRLAWKNLINWLDKKFVWFAMMAFVALYWGWSMKSPLNIGFRHLFPSIPFIYMLSVGAWRGMISSRTVRNENSDPIRVLGKIIGAFVKSWFFAGVLVVLILWFTISSLSSYPFFISYFNPLGGGTGEGYRYVTDSNYDWGQDLLRLDKFVEQNPNIDKIAVDYFGGGNPAYYLGDKLEPWWSGKGDPRKVGIEWLAVSVNTLQSAMQPTAHGFTRLPTDEYRWLEDLRGRPDGIGALPEPDFRAGTSIFIYHLTN